MYWNNRSSRVSCINITWGSTNGECQVWAVNFLLSHSQIFSIMLKFSSKYFAFTAPIRLYWIVDCISANELVDTVELFYWMIFYQDVGENLACSNTSLASQESNQGPKLLRFGVRSFFWKKAYRTYRNWGLVLSSSIWNYCELRHFSGFTFTLFSFETFMPLCEHNFLFLQGIHEQLRVREPEPAPQPACEPREPWPPLLGRLQPSALPQACVASSPKFRLHNNWQFEWSNI
jgi:hypothetical protein